MLNLAGVSYFVPVVSLTWLNVFVGKFVVGYMPVGGEKEYYLASACGELYAPPSAYVALYGLTVQQTFLRGNCMYSYFLWILKPI
jgi:hypothetical protein